MVATWLVELLLDQINRALLEDTSEARTAVDDLTARLRTFLKVRQLMPLLHCPWIPRDTPRFHEWQFMMASANCAIKAGRAERYVSSMWAARGRIVLNGACANCRSMWRCSTSALLCTCWPAMAAWTMSCITRHTGRQATLSLFILPAMLSGQTCVLL